MKLGTNFILKIAPKKLRPHNFAPLNLWLQVPGDLLDLHERLYIYTRIRWSLSKFQSLSSNQHIQSTKIKNNNPKSLIDIKRSYTPEIAPIWNELILFHKILLIWYEQTLSHTDLEICQW